MFYLARKRPEKAAACVMNDGLKARLDQPATHEEPLYEALHFVEPPPVSDEFHVGDEASVTQTQIFAVKPDREFICATVTVPRYCAQSESLACGTPPAFDPVPTSSLALVLSTTHSPFAGVTVDQFANVSLRS
jgi:hypothetical protein